MKQIIALVCVTLLPSVHAQTWNCSNPDLEIGCGKNTCSALARGDFTPMSVGFTDNGVVSVCAYSGCWEGKGKVHRDARFLSIHAIGLTYHPDVNGDGERHDIAILLDTSDNVALLKSGGYAQPLLCRVISLD